MKRVPFLSPSFSAVAALVGCSLLCTVAPAAAPPTAPPRTVPDTVQNLRAFAKLYGYVRFFHPSDEAAAIDWNRFAIYGAEKVRTCENRQELASTLRGLFAPIAPTLQVYEEGGTPAAVWMPAQRDGLLPVAWCHQGIELSQPNVYRSTRSNRAPREAQIARFLQGVTGPQTGRRVRLGAWSRSADQDPEDPARLWLSAAKPGVPDSGDTNQVAVALVSTEWLRYEATIELGRQSTSEIYLGVDCGRRGKVWLDDLTLEIEREPGRWEAIAIRDGDLEDRGNLEQSGAWFSGGVVAERAADAHGGARCLLIQPDTPEAFIEAHLKPSDYVDKPLDRGLACRVPLCLLSDARHTLPEADTTSFGRLRREVSAVTFDSLSGRNVGVRLGDVTVAWNVLQHSYPYFDVVATDWDTVLTRAMERALPDQDEMEFLWNLRQMAAALEDGHASGVRYLPDTRRRTASLPAGFDMVEGKVTIVSTGNPEVLKRGDVVQAIDGRDADSLVAETEKRYSGSPRWRRARALGEIRRGDEGQAMRLAVRRGDELLDLEANCLRVYKNADRRDSIRQEEPGIWYVNLSRAPMAAIDSVMSELAQARGVIFDLRGYPRNNHDVISHLLTVADTSRVWMQVPEIVYPDRERIAGWKKFGWNMQPKEPHIAGKVVFLTNGSAISYAESFLGFVEGYHLGEIVGEPTAGANGNVNQIALPGDYMFPFTGMKVLKHDGSQHHLVGVQPTIPVRVTLEAVREGRDEYIEKALQWIKA